MRKERKDKRNSRLSYTITKGKIIPENVQGTSSMENEL